MRVTQESMYRTMLTDVMRLQAEQFATSQQVSTNRKVNAPSESDYAVTILRSRLSLNEVDQYKVNLEASNSWMTASESAMQSIVDRLTRASAVAEQMSTGTYQSDQQAAASAEVANIIDQIISLANTAMNGSYIFGGTRNDVPAVLNTLTAPDPATLASDGASSHSTEASIYHDAISGSYFLRVGRQTGGTTSTITLSPLSTLGSGLGLDFTSANFTQTQIASSNPVQPDIYTSNEALTGAGDLVSSRIGETLAWTGAGAPQTYVTQGKVTFTGDANGETVTVDGADVYNLTATDAASSAANLVDQINAAGLDYYAYTVQDGSNWEVYISDKTPGATFHTVTGMNTANKTVDGDTTLQEMVNQINSGEKATGVLHIAAAPVAASIVTVGGANADWTTILTGVVPAPATPAEYAAALVSWINANNQDVTASYTANPAGGASVQVTARNVGVAGNAIALASTDANVTASAAALLGGLDGADTTGKLMGAGESTLRLDTTVRGEVLAVDPVSGAVSMRLSWYDDAGQYQTTDATIPEGEGSAVTITQLGGLQLYRDDKVYKVGAVFDLELTHYQGDDGSINVNFSNGTRMAYNWTAHQLLGDSASVNLDGGAATANRQPGSTGNLTMSGVYRGLMSRDLTFDVVDAGQVPGDDVTFRVTWSDDQGLAHDKLLTVSGAGADNMVALPVFGDTPRIELDGDQATAGGANVGTGGVHITGTYQGFHSRDFSYTVVDGGQLPSDPVTIRATWTDDQGQSHSEDLTFAAGGADNAQELPGSEGVKIYLDPSTTGNYAAGDTYDYSLSLNPAHAGEAIYFHLDNGAFQVGDSFHYGIDKNPLSVLDTLKEWQYQLANGDAEAAQTQSQRTLEAIKKALNTMMDYIADSGTRQNRVTVRGNVLEDHETYSSKNLQDLQDVDLTQAFMDLRAQQTAYDASLKVISEMSKLFLADMI